MNRNERGGDDRRDQTPEQPWRTSREPAHLVPGHPSPADVSGRGERARGSGSAEVQVAIMTHRIKHLTEHLKEHKKDNHTRRGLMQLIGKRRRLLKYIKDRDIDNYRALIKKLGIRDHI